MWNNFDGTANLTSWFGFVFLGMWGKKWYLIGKTRVYLTGGWQIIFQHKVSEKVISCGIRSVVLAESKMSSGRFGGQKRLWVEWSEVELWAVEMNRKSGQSVLYFSFGIFFMSYIIVFQKGKALRNWEQKAICVDTYALNEEKADFHPICLKDPLPGTGL